MKSYSAFLLIVLTIFSLGFNSCKDTKDDQSDAVTQQDRDFATNASNSNIAEIRLGELALQKSDNDSVMNFGKAMIMEHTAARIKLDSIAKSININQSSQNLDQAHQTLYNRLSALSKFAFDTAYMNSQVRDHQATRSLFENQRDKGKNQQLVNYAQKNLPAINRHLEHASSLLKWLNSNAGNSGAGAK